MDISLNTRTYQIFSHYSAIEWAANGAWIIPMPTGTVKIIRIIPDEEILVNVFLIVVLQNLHMLAQSICKIHLFAKPQLYIAKLAGLSIGMCAF